MNLRRSDTHALTRSAMFDFGWIFGSLLVVAWFAAWYVVAGLSAWRALALAVGIQVISGVIGLIRTIRKVARL